MGDSVSNQVAQHLGETVGVGVKRPGDGLELEVALAEQREIASEVLEELIEIDRPRFNQLARLSAGQREHVRHQAIELVQPPQQRDGRLVPAPHVGLPSRSSTWARSTARGVRSSCEASDTKSRWRVNAPWSRSSMRSKASARIPTSPWPAIGPVRSDSSPALTAAATRAIRRS